jgi:uncharacterized hydrophobic protein (TIGR00271 family)
MSQTEHDSQEIIRTNIRDGSSINFGYIYMNILSAIIISYGLFSDSPAIIIGGAIIAMLLDPMAAIALSFVEKDTNLFKQSVCTLICGISTIFTISFLIGSIHIDMHLTSEITSRTSPNIIEIVISLAGGAAGAYAIVAPRLNSAIIGVAIVVALASPLATSGILIARGEYSLAFSAFTLAFINMIMIQSVTYVVMWGVMQKHKV